MVGYLTPDSVPADTVCIPLIIPDDEGFLAVVRGALQVLIDPASWTQYGTLTPQQSAQALVDMFDKFCFREGSCRMVGEIVVFAGANSPDAKWLLCNGASLLRVDYPDLFLEIGTTYGAIDSEHFTIPNLSGKVPMGVSGGHALGASGGAETHQLTVAELAQHSHSDSGHLHVVNFLAAPLVGSFTAGVPLNYAIATPGSSAMASANIQNTGGDGAHNNLQPFQVINYFIVALP